MNANTGELVETVTFADPGLRWERDFTDVTTVEDGKLVNRKGPLGWQLRQWYGGRVLKSWLDANPRPRE